MKKTLRSFAIRLSPRWMTATNRFWKWKKYLRSFAVEHNIEIFSLLKQNLRFSRCFLITSSTMYSMLQIVNNVVIWVLWSYSSPIQPLSDLVCKNKRKGWEVLRLNTDRPIHSSPFSSQLSVSWLASHKVNNNVDDSRNIALAACPSFKDFRLWSLRKKKDLRSFTVEHNIEIFSRLKQSLRPFNGFLSPLTMYSTYRKVDIL